MKHEGVLFGDIRFSLKAVLVPEKMASIKSLKKLRGWDAQASWVAVRSGRPPPPLIGTTIDTHLGVGRAGLV